IGSYQSLVRGILPREYERGAIVAAVAGRADQRAGVMIRPTDDHLAALFAGEGQEGSVVAKAHQLRKSFLLPRLPISIDDRADQFLGAPSRERRVAVS